VHDATFACSDLPTFTRVDDLGLKFTGKRVEQHGAVLGRLIVQPDNGCRCCDRADTPRDTVPHRVQVRLASRHEQHGTAARNAVSSQSAVGVGGH